VSWKFWLKSTNILRQTSSPQRDNHRRPATRSRSNTAHTYAERYSSHDEPPPMPEPEVRPSIRSTGRVASSSRIDRHDEYAMPDSPQRSNYSRSNTFQGPTTIHRESTPVNGMRKASIPQDPASLRAQLRPSNRINTNGSDVFGDPSDDSTLNSASPDRSYNGDRSVSPATSHGSAASRSASYSVLTNSNANGRKGPPPPPPSRAKKPAPPPPPMKRAEISSTSLNRY
jgi:hypothetical protein